MSDEPKNQPAETKQFDRVHAALWKQQGQNDGPDGEYWSLSLSRNYKNAKGEWQRTSFFTMRDIPHVALAVEWAQKQLLLKSD